MSEDLTGKTSAQILELFPKSIDLGLRPAYLDLMEKLGNPQKSLPAVFHVAGTNGKGSTCAFLRAALEANGHRVHVYTSPHLVRFHERIRVAGELISEPQLVDILGRIFRLAEPGTVTVFEAITAAAFVAFAETKADYTILEVGLGGRLDATNIVERPLASIITRLSFDHRQHLGNTMQEIAGEKAGIMRQGVPCFAAPQPDAAALATLRRAAAAKGTPLSVGGEDWRVEPHAGGFHFHDATHELDLPPPSLLGAHQFLNAGLAVAALSVLPFLPREALARGVATAEWPARLQRLKTGALPSLLPSTAELWLDGGHNDSAGEVLAQQMVHWRQQDGASPRSLHLICGMLSTKTPREFLEPLAPHITSALFIDIPDEPLGLPAADLATEAAQAGFGHVSTAVSLDAALGYIAATAEPRARVLICGSLYLAGHVLRENGS